MRVVRFVIAYAIGRISRYISNPGPSHWIDISRVLRFFKGRMCNGLCYSGEFPVLEGYSDASWITNKEDSSFTSGWVFMYGGGVILWSSKKQTCISDSTMT